MQAFVTKVTIPLGYIKWIFIVLLEHFGDGELLICYVISIACWKENLPAEESYKHALFSFTLFCPSFKTLAK